MSTLNYVPNFMFEFFETYTLNDDTGKKVCPAIEVPCYHPWVSRHEP